MILRIGTRGSKLALVQSGWVKEKIEDGHPHVEVTLVQIKTKGDKILDSPLSKIGGKGLFVKEIEEALLRGEVDLAVHSMKDVPAELPSGLEFSVFPEREDPRDAFVSPEYRSFQDLPEGAAVGTGSMRRSAQLLHRRPDIRIVPMRGNVDTRLRKLSSGDCLAVILAAAGLNRLGLSQRIARLLPPEEFLPAIGQGALGLETRTGDHATLELLRFLNHGDTETAVRAERAFLKTLGGGCQVPVACHGSLKGDVIVLDGMVAELDGSRVIREQGSGARDRAEDLGVALAEQLLAMGAERILAKFYGRA
ncbi:MAG: hydroxymethylbilane synthase [Deltaproteobacteria bacterium]|nr:hydroxymethylbilane synthase [Deltaproteobacteria bacterium]